MLRSRSAELAQCAAGSVAHYTSHTCGVAAERASFKYLLPASAAAVQGPQGSRLDECGLRWLAQLAAIPGVDAGLHGGLG